MSANKNILALSLTLAACGGGAKESAAPPSAATAAEDFRSQPPPAGEVPELRAPVPEKRVLGNGLTVYVVEKRDLPLVHARFVLESGSANDPRGKLGLAGFVADMLKAGTKTRNAQQIADEIETLGASLDISVDEDATSVGFTSMTPNYPAALDVVTDVLQNSVFAKDEVERTRKRRLAALEQQADDPSSTATRVFQEVVFGAHPYAHLVLGHEADVSKMTQADLLAFYKKSFRPANTSVIVVGDVTVDAAIDLITRKVGGWKGDTSATPPPPDATPRGRELTLVNRADAPQSQLRIGHLGVARSHPDYFPLIMANAILGGMFNSRINMNLREAKGYTYGARSAFDFLRSRGSFVVYSGVRSDVTAEAIREVLKEINLMRESNVSPEELLHAKNSYSLSLPSMFQTVGAIASMVANIHVYDLPLDYYQHLPEKIAAVTIDDVRRVTREHINPEQLSITVVGNKNQVEPALRDLGIGDLKLRAADGTPL
jgi:zinc protease